MVSLADCSEWLSALEPVVREAGRIILNYRAQGFESELKSDKSPVTQADKAADELIVAALLQLTPHIPIVSEEGSQEASVSENGCFWCVDPLDGTKGFMRGESEFTVNIGLIYEHMPVLGMIYIPAINQLYGGLAGGLAYRIWEDGAKQPICVRAYPATGLHAITSSRHGSNKEQELRDEHGVTSFSSASSSLKFCRIAEGVADIYPRYGTTMEWDTAAGHAILRAAGGDVYDLDTKQPLRYGKPDFRNGQFVAKKITPCDEQ